MRKITLLLFIGIFAMIMLSFTEAGKTSTSWFKRRGDGEQRNWKWSNNWTASISHFHFGLPYLHSSLVALIHHNNYFHSHVLNSLSYSNCEIKGHHQGQGQQQGSSQKSLTRRSQRTTQIIQQQSRSQRIRQGRSWSTHCLKSRSRQGQERTIRMNKIMNSNLRNAD